MFFDDNSFDDNSSDDSSSGIWGSVIGAVSQTAQTAIIAGQNNSLQVPYPRPVSSTPFTPSNFGSTSGIMSWLVVGALLLGGVFAFKKLK
jgi:hypothetical protein